MYRIIINVITGAFLTVIAAGCSTTHFVKWEEDLRIYENATLVGRNNAKIDVKNTTISGDSIVAIDYYSNFELHFHISDIQKVVVTNRGKGAKQGLLFGGAAGAISGYLAFEDNRAEAALWSGGMSAMIGILPGAIIGSKEIYILEARDGKKAEAQKSTQTSGISIEPGTKVIKSNRKRRFWYLGLELAGGFGNLPTNDESILSTDKNSSGTCTGGYPEIGLTVKPNLLLGIQVSGFGDYKYEYENRSSTDRGMTNLFLVATYFPKSKGFFTRGGLGYSSYNIHSEMYVPSEYRDEVLYDYTEKGIGGQIGVGYAFWLGRHFNLTINANISGNFFKDNKALTWTKFLLGFMWY